MVIIDTGPLVALFDDTEPAHKHCHAVLKKQVSAPVTTWLVLTEAFHFLGGWARGQGKLCDFILSGGVHVGGIPEELHPRIHELMKQYSDNPMDLADASLVALAEHHRIKKIFTLDRRDFSRYRPKHCARFEIIPWKYLYQDKPKLKENQKASLAELAKLAKKSSRNLLT